MTVSVPLGSFPKATKSAGNPVPGFRKKIKEWRVCHGHMEGFGEWSFMEGWVCWRCRCLGVGMFGGTLGKVGWVVGVCLRGHQSPQPGAPTRGQTCL